jgi:hypothetical protein
MESTRNLFFLCKNLDEKEESIVDKEGDIFDPILSVSSISESKNKLVALEIENYDVLSSARASISRFCQEQTCHFPEFVSWCATNYSHTKRVIVAFDGSKILCRVNSQVIRDSLGLFHPFPQNFVSFDEVELTRVYKECSLETKNEFLSKILKPGQSIEGLSLPCDVNIFQESVQLVFSLLSQAFGS